MGNELVGSRLTAQSSRLITMGIERITSSLVDDAKKDAEDIVRAAEQHVQRMLSEEKAKREKLLKSVGQDVEKVLEEHRREREAWARLEAKRILAEAKEDAIKNVFEDMFDRLGELRKTPEYKSFIKENVSRAFDELKGKELVVHCLKGEKSLIPNGAKAKVIEDLDAAGGATVETADKKIRIDSTLEAVFNVKREGIRKKVYEKLFGAEKKKEAKNSAEQKTGEKKKKK